MADQTMVERGPQTRSVLQEAVEIHTLPVERLKGKPKGEIVDIKKVEDKIAALEKVGEHYEVAIYDGQGNLREIEIDPSSSSFNTQVKVKADSPYGETVESVLGSRGFSEEDRRKAQALWDRDARGFYQHDYPASPNEMQRKPYFFTLGEWKMDISDVIWNKGKPDELSQKTFVFSNGSTKHALLFKPGVTPEKRNLTRDTEIDVVNLTDSLKLVPKGAFFRLEDKTGKEISSFSGTDALVDPSNPNQLYFINAGQVYTLDVGGVADRSTKPVLEKQISAANPQELQFDPNGNFLIVRSGNELLILDKETGDQISSFKDVKGPIFADKQGDILYVDSQGAIKEVQTNFQAISPGGSDSVLRKKQEALEKARERFEKLELKKSERAKSGIVSEESVAQVLRDNISRQVSDKITSSTSADEIEEVLDSLQALKGDPANKGYTEVIDEFVDQARDRLSIVRTGEFNNQLGAFEKALGEIKSVRDAIDLDEQFAKILQLRQKIEIRDPKVRRDIEKKLEELQSKKEAIGIQYQQQLLDAVNQILPGIAELIKETGSLRELGYLSESAQAQQFEIMLANVKDPKVRKEIRDRFNQFKDEQKAKLQEESIKTEERDRLRYAQLIEESRADLASLREQIEELGDARGIDRFGRNPLVTAWRSKLLALPAELREIEEKKLEIIMGARKKDIEHRKELGAVGKAGELQFGEAKFSVFTEPPKIWQPKLIPIEGGLWADLVFEDAQGRVFRPAGKNEVLVNNDLNNEITRAVVERYRKAAEEYFRGIKRKVPEFDERWKITDFHMGKLEEIAETLNLQLLPGHGGILILEGEAGTGKNVLVDILANLSNREMVTVQCNEGTTKEDLTYDFDYDPKTGTVRWPSKLLEGLQKPGTIIFFDEINALRPGIAKMMNSLFDYHRRLSFTAGGIPKEIIADPSVIFIGAMNPQNYAGVSPLSREVKSRARVIDVDYPPFEEKRGGRTYYKSYEAEMLAAYMDELGELNQKEFRLAWDYIINKDTSNGADAIVAGNPTIETDIRRIYDVIRVANRLREMYKAYQIGDSNEPMEFPTSLREVTDIVMEMNHRQGVKPIIKRVIVPKIDDRRQKRLVEQTIDAVLPGA